MKPNGVHADPKIALAEQQFNFTNKNETLEILGGEELKVYDAYT